MKTLSRDTNPKMEELQIAMWRKLTPADRFSKMRYLTSDIIWLSKRAIRRANPQLSEGELDLKFVTLHYGDDLARRLREYLEKKK